MKRIPTTKYPAAQLYLDDVWQIANLLSEHFSSVQIALGDMLAEHPDELTEAATELLQRDKKFYISSCTIRAENERVEGGKRTDWFSIHIGWKCVEVQVSDLRDPGLPDILAQIETIIKRRSMPQWPRYISTVVLASFVLAIALLPRTTFASIGFTVIFWIAVMVMMFTTYKDYSGKVYLQSSETQN